MPFTLISFLKKNAWLPFLCKFSKFDVRHWVYFLLFGNVKADSIQNKRLPIMKWTSNYFRPIMDKLNHATPLFPSVQTFFYTTINSFFLRMSFNFIFHAKLYTPSTLNIDLILWHTQFIKCAENVKSWVFPLTFQAYILPHTLNCICVNLFKFHILIFKHF